MAETRDQWIGPNNPMWKGACLRKNKSYRGPDWAEVAERIRKRDRFACRHCGMTQEEHLGRWSQSLEVHHVIPFHEFTDYKKANRAANLIALCKTCHMRADRAIKSRQLLIPLFDEGRKKPKDGIHRGSNNARALLTEDQVKEVKVLLRSNERQADIAERFGVKKHVISAISTGQNWSHVR